MTRSKLTGVEIIAVIIAVVAMLLALLLFVMAIVTTFSPAVRHAENVTTSKAWTASLTSGVLASWIVSGVIKHFDRRRT